MDVPLYVWAATLGVIAAMLALDLLVLHRDAHEVSMREAALTSAMWVALGVAFGVGVWAVAGGEHAGEYFAGYLIEKSLSVDNIFVFALIFGYFAVPAKYQHRVLFWGVVGALVMRAGFIAAGATLLDRFSWMVYVFGAFLVVTGIRLARHRNVEIHPERNPVLRVIRRIMPMTSEYRGDSLVTRDRGRLVATPMLAALALSATFDVVFAVDSIPAIFAVTRDTFIVYAANAFSLLGLAALYFVLAGMIDRFRYLNVGLAAVLVFVGLKMTLADVYKIPVYVSLAVIVAALAAAVLASVLRPPRRGHGDRRPTRETAAATEGTR